MIPNLNVPHIKVENSFLHYAADYPKKYTVGHKRVLKQKLECLGLTACNSLFFCLRELTKVPHMATTAGDNKTIEFMLQRWQDPESGLDQAWREDYKVYLSFPDKTQRNKVTVGEFH